MFFYSNDSFVTIENINIVSDSVITGNMIAGIGYSAATSDLTMNTVTINGWVNA